MSKRINPGNTNFQSPTGGEATVQLAHGGGGAMMQKLIGDLFVRTFDNSTLRRQDDNATIAFPGGRLAFSTDSYVVDPIFFPGGNIGHLAVHGTVNDLCTGGGRPVALSAGFILEEGFPISELQKIASSMQEAAREAGVEIVTGDTKVVDKGKADKIFINTAGVALIEHGFQIHCENVRSTDKVIITGSVGDHGVAVLAARESLALQSPVHSDTAPLNGLVAEVLAAVGRSIHAMRDPTRGGIAATLNEMASSSKVGICIWEDRVPVRPAVAGACEILGLDPLYLANEGKMLIFVAAEAAERALEIVRGHRYGREAALIGEVNSADPGLVSLRTGLGAWRILDMPAGLQLPRIC